jgi:hypothetical protein
MTRAGRQRRPVLRSLFPERLELAGPFVSGPGCRGHPVYRDLRLDAGQLREPCLGACGLNVHLILLLFA